MTVKRAEFKWGRLSRRQKKILKWWTSDKYRDYNGIIADGAIRSGKTVAMGMSFVLWAMETFDGADFAICGKTISALRRNVINTLKKQMSGRRWQVEDKRSDNLLIVTANGRTNTFYLFGGKDEGSQDLIQGLTLAGVLFDEVALMPQSFVNQATGRCSVDGSKWWFNCNPAGPQHWFKLEWIDKAREKQLVYLHFTMSDNLTLTERIRQRYESMYSGVFFKRYILGLWVAAEGLIYDTFDKSRNVFKKMPTSGEYYVSADYGIQNATTFLLWQKTEGNVWCQIDEYYYSGRDNMKQKTVAELADGLEGMLAGRKEKHVILDPSAEALEVELRKRKHKVKHADNAVLDGIADVSLMLQQGRLMICETCKHTIREFESYAWDSKAADRGEDKPIKTNDHCMDAVRYFVKTMKLVKRDKKESEGITEWL